MVVVVLDNCFFAFSDAPDEEGTVPVLMELRKSLFSILAKDAASPRPEYKFRLSGLVDLTMYFFNYVDGKQF